MADENTIEVQESEKQEVEQSEAERTRSGVAFIPRSDIYETEDAIHLVLDMPGVTEDNVEITLEQDVLSIRGYVESEGHEDYQLVYREYRVGDYERQFQVSTRIDADDIEATLSNGVLRMRLPKAQETQRTISVKGA